MEKVKEKIKISYINAKSAVADFKVQRALRMLINEEDIKKILREAKSQ